MKILDSTKKKVAAATIATVAIAGAGVASAFWSTDGDGTGSAAVGTDTAWVVSTTNDPNAPALAPDGPTQTIVVNVKNEGSGVQRLEALDIKVANADGSPWTGTPGCSAADFAIGGEAAGATHTISTINHEINPGDTDSSQSFNIQMVNSSSNQDNCKGVAVPLHVHAS
jgi:hypothetical protein